jgi:hypothetical protein
MIKDRTNMTSISCNDDRLMRYGHPVYEINPSLPYSLIVKRHSQQSLTTSNDNESSRNPGTSQQVNPATDTVINYRKSLQVATAVTTDLLVTQEVDSERFVKIYLDGIRQYAQLNKSGTNLFEFIYEQLSSSDAQNQDTVCLNYLLAIKWKSDLNRRTYSRGIADLLDKEFIFRSIVNDIYFINVRFMFNGDRLSLIECDRD